MEAFFLLPLAGRMDLIRFLTARPSLGNLHFLREVVGSVPLEPKLPLLSIDRIPGSFFDTYRRKEVVILKAKRFLFIVVILLISGISRVGNATPITLSFGGEESRYSDRNEPGEPSADVFAGGARFTLTGDLLAITLENLTASPDGYTISEFYFNLSSRVGSILLDPGLNSGSLSIARNESADGMGTYDVAVDLGAGNAGIAPGDSLVVFLRVSGTGLTEEDFIERSNPHPGNNPQLAVMKFTQGPGGDSAFIGANPPQPVPEPATLALFIGGGLLTWGASWKRKRLLASSPESSTKGKEA